MRLSEILKRIEMFSEKANSLGLRNLLMTKREHFKEKLGFRSFNVRNFKHVELLTQTFSKYLSF